MLHHLLALYCYEYVLTLRQEISYIWANKWTIATWIFVANRYTALVSAMQVFFPIADSVVRSASEPLSLSLL